MQRPSAAQRHAARGDEDEDHGPWALYCIERPRPRPRRGAPPCFDGSPRNVRSTPSASTADPSPRTRTTTSVPSSHASRVTRPTSSPGSYAASQPSPRRARLGSPPGPGRVADGVEDGDDLRRRAAVGVKRLLSVVRKGAGQEDADRSGAVRSGALPALRRRARTGRRGSVAPGAAAEFGISSKGRRNEFGGRERARGRDDAKGRNQGGRGGRACCVSGQKTIGREANRRAQTRGQNESGPPDRDESASKDESERRIARGQGRRRSTNRFEERAVRKMAGQTRGRATHLCSSTQLARAVSRARARCAGASTSARSGEPRHRAVRPAAGSAPAPSRKRSRSARATLASRCRLGERARLDRALKPALPRAGLVRYRSCVPATTAASPRRPGRRVLGGDHVGDAVAAVRLHEGVRPPVLPGERGVEKVRSGAGVRPRETARSCSMMASASAGVAGPRLQRRRRDCVRRQARGRGGRAP